MVLAQMPAPTGFESVALDVVVIAALVVAIVLAIRALRDRRR